MSFFDSLNSFAPGLGALGMGLGSIAGVATSVLNYNEQKKANAQNQANFDKQFAYNQYLNEHQYQINAQDMRQAGINPVASVNPSVSSFSGSAQQVGATAENPMVSLIPLLTTAMSNKSAEKIAESNNETQKDINAQNNQTAENINKANIDNQRVLQRLDHAQQDKIARFGRQTSLLLEDKKGAIAQAMQDSEHKWQDSGTHQQVLKDMEYYKFKIEDLLRDKDIARQSVTLYDGRTVTYNQLEADIKQAYEAFDHDKTQQAFDNFLKGVVPVLNAFCGLAGRGK